MVVFWKKQGFTAVLAIVVEANGHASGIWILTNGGNCLISIIDAMTQVLLLRFPLAASTGFSLRFTLLLFQVSGLTSGFS